MFLDDILFYSPTLEEHEEHLCKVFQLLRDNSLYAKEKKCEFFKDSIQYLGCVISTVRVAMNASTVDAILQWPAPHSTEELQIYLGITGFYHKYVNG